jgi:tetratricopeptide (TPR) repeat protein
MKQIIILIFAFFTSMSVYCQVNTLDAGNQCFDKGDYVCAEAKYKEVLKSVVGIEKQKAQIKINRANSCNDYLKTANQAFASQNYQKAKKDYQLILESNPKDDYSKNQIEKCDTKINESKTTRLNNSSPISSPSQSNPQVTKNAIKTNVLKSEAKMRESDSPISNTLYILPAGKQVNVFGLTSSGYYKVEYSGKIGYINEMYFLSSEINKNNANQTIEYINEPIPTKKVKPKLRPFSSLGFQSGEIAKYGFIYERGGKRAIGFHLSARTSLTPEEDILNGTAIENKTEIDLGPNLKIFNRLYLNIGVGYGYYNRVLRNDYANTVDLEKTGYLLATSGLMMRISRVININAGVSFIDIDKAFYNPEITFGLSFNLKKR